MKHALKLLVLSLFLFAAQAKAQTCAPLPAHCVWMTVTEASITGIANVEIFRNGTLLDTIAPTALSYMDATVKAGQTYTYSAVNVDGSNVSSVPTGLVTAIIPPDSTTAQYSFVISPTSLGFNGTVGGSNPASQAIQVADTGPSGYHIPFTATSSAPWLLVTSSSSQTAAVLTVSVNTAGLSSGLDTGYIDIVGNATNSPQHIVVNLGMVNLPSQSGTTTCSWPTKTKWRCDTTFTNVPTGQATKSVVTSGSVTTTTNGVKP